ncbi:unnamed protein product, partial [Didymodactylos carnosus]
PRRICTKAGFCPNTTEENTPESLIIENIVSDGHGQSAVSTNVYDSNQTCIMKLNNQECLTLVENYSPTILSILAQEFDPSSICQKLRVCTAQLSQRLNTQYLTKASPSSCGICDYFSTYLHFAIQRDPSETSIRKALETVCTHLGVDKHAECETLVALYTPQIVSGSVKLEMGNNFCNDLKICQKPMIELTPGIETPPQLIHIPLTRVETPVNHHLSSYDIKQILDKNIDADPECTICHYVVSYLDAILKNNKSEAAIEAALARVCSILPVKERGQCDQFVKNYGPVLAELIAEFADPQTVCRYLGMCQVILPESTTTATKKPSSTTSVYDNHQYVDINVPTSSHLNSPFTCTICTYVVSRLKYIIIEDKTEEKIMQELDKTCGLFSALDLRRECKTFVDEYGPYLVQVISQDVDAKVACQNLKICPKSELQLPWKMPTKLPDVKLPSSSISTKKPYPKCIFGMSYWCTSRENAQLCNVSSVENFQPTDYHFVQCILQTAINCFSVKSFSITTESSSDFTSAFDKKCHTIELELETLRESGENVPDKIPDEKWQDIFRLQNLQKRIRMYNYLFNREQSKKHQSEILVQNDQRRKNLLIKRQKLLHENKPLTNYPGYSTIYRHLSARQHEKQIYETNRLLPAARLKDYLIIDCEFEDEYERLGSYLINLINQLQHVYSGIEEFHTPSFLYFCNLNTNGRLYQQFQKYSQFENYCFEITSKSYIDLFPREKLCYITSSSTNIMKEYEHDTIYIIGAIVTPEKRPLTLAKAKRNQIRHQCLPLDYYVKFNSGSNYKNLTLNQVYNILMTAKHTQNNWYEAFKHISDYKLAKRYVNKTRYQ